MWEVPLFDAEIQPKFLFCALFCIAFNDSEAIDGKINWVHFRIRTVKYKKNAPTSATFYSVPVLYDNNKNSFASLGEGIFLKLEIACKAIIHFKIDCNEISLLLFPIPRLLKCSQQPYSPLMRTRSKVFWFWVGYLYFFSPIMLLSFFIWISCPIIEVTLLGSVNEKYISKTITWIFNNIKRRIVSVDLIISNYFDSMSFQDNLVRRIHFFWNIRENHKKIILHEMIQTIWRTFLTLLAFPV